VVAEITGSEVLAAGMFGTYNDRRILLIDSEMTYVSMSVAMI